VDATGIIDRQRIERVGLQQSACALVAGQGHQSRATSGGKTHRVAALALVRGLRNYVIRQGLGHSEQGRGLRAG
jgi:hypothetical protein